MEDEVAARTVPPYLEEIYRRMAERSEKFRRECEAIKESWRRREEEQKIRDAADKARREYERAKLFDLIKAGHDKRALRRYRRKYSR
ncbi:MAG TPA: hypothetical protein VJ276_14275 [Thermoanaerobaculia bacterium]|nr:hypothetical protein [Thermoanaerobaculia bacterium]